MTKLNQLKEALIAWRKAEKEHARAVLSAQLPSTVSTTAEAEASALLELRMILESEPWADIEQGL